MHFAWSNYLNMLGSVKLVMHIVILVVGMILRESLLVSSMLFNSEAWYNLTNAELDLLETIDLAFLRQLLQAQKGTQKKGCS